MAFCCSLVRLGSQWRAGDLGVGTRTTLALIMHLPLATHTVDVFPHPTLWTSFSLLQQLVLMLSSLVGGDSACWIFFFPKMVMKLLKHDTSLIRWENEVLPSRRKFTKHNPPTCNHIIEQLRPTQLPKRTNPYPIKQHWAVKCTFPLWYCAFLKAQKLNIPLLLWFFWLD